MAINALETQASAEMIHLSTGPLTVIDTSISSALWDKAIEQLKQHISTENFSLWVAPISCRSLENNLLTLIAPNPFLRDWFHNHYLATVLGYLETLHRESFDTPLSVQTVWLIQESEETHTATPALGKTNLYCPQLLTKYTFDSFVVGPSNQLALAASQAVAQMPAQRYNPLFIYGRVGLGKTHLLHAIGHAIYRSHPQWRILYVKAEAFLNEYIFCVRNNQLDNFRARYRDNTDVLLMDDIHYLAGKERTQDEFFHTFNALFENRKQIVVTADKYPHEIPDLEERLRSRFQWGLIADIQTPELETRMAILVKKAAHESIYLPSEVAYFLAAHIDSNVRELEGLLLRVAATAALAQQPISLELTQNTLKGLLTLRQTKVTLEAIMREVAAYYQITIPDLKSQHRQQRLARPRQIAMYLARKLCQLSYPELGMQFGGKDHTTVLSACRRITALHDQDAQLRQILGELENKLNNSCVVQASSV